MGDFIKIETILKNYEKKLFKTKGDFTVEAFYNHQNQIVNFNFNEDLSLSIVDDKLMYSPREKGHVMYLTIQNNVDLEHLEDVLQYACHFMKEHGDITCICVLNNQYMAINYNYDKKLKLDNNPLFDRNFGRYSKGYLATLTNNDNILKLSANNLNILNEKIEGISIYKDTILFINEILYNYEMKQEKSK